MTIRQKLLVFIPLLVLLANSVTFFLFESGKIVRQSYDVMMDRILLYNNPLRRPRTRSGCFTAIWSTPAEAAEPNWGKCGPSCSIFAPIFSQKQSPLSLPRH